MPSYDQAAVTGVTCVQFDGSNIATLQTVCRDARMDQTMERTVTVPVGGSHGQVRRMYVGDWLFSAATGEFIVMPNSTFAALFTASP